MPALTLGVEEEYLLVDPETRDLVSDPPDEFMQLCQEALGDQVSPEFLRCQIEIGTPVCADVKQVRTNLTGLRSTIIRIAEKCGMRVIAASTHPFGQWGKQKHTQADRYELLNRDMQGIIRRMLICGMHVHAGIEDKDERIDLMNQARYFLPHLLALSTSSPFWEGHSMGMKCSRLSIFDSMPRTGFPDRFENWSEYERVIGRLVDAGVMEDFTKIWWDLRPSARFPTLEMRITDVCTRLEDALAITAMYQSILCLLSRLRRRNQRWRIYPAMMMNENRWRAQRYGISQSMVDLGKGVQLPFEALLEELLEELSDCARSLECEAELNHARTIVSRGTSACRQTARFEEAKESGADDHEALVAVVDLIIEETKADLPAFG